MNNENKNDIPTIVKHGLTTNRVEFIFRQLLQCIGVNDECHQVMQSQKTRIPKKRMGHHTREHSTQLVEADKLMAVLSSVPTDTWFLAHNPSLPFPTLRPNILRNLQSPLTS